jgi:hypothetical protein
MYKAVKENDGTYCKMAKKVRFTPAQARIACSCINRFSSGQHPYATPQELPYFTALGVAAPLRRAIKAGILTPRALGVAKRILQFVTVSMD